MFWDSKKEDKFWPLNK